MEGAGDNGVLYVAMGTVATLGATSYQQMPALLMLLMPVRHRSYRSLLCPYRKQICRS
jgi:hypothetical protein